MVLFPKILNPMFPRDFMIATMCAVVPLLTPAWAYARDRHLNGFLLAVVLVAAGVGGAIAASLWKERALPWPQRRTAPWHDTQWVRWPLLLLATVFGSMILVDAVAPLFSGFAGPDAARYARAAVVGSLAFPVLLDNLLLKGPAAFVDGLPPATPRTDLQRLIGLEAWCERHLRSWWWPRAMAAFLPATLLVILELFIERPYPSVASLMVFMTLPGWGRTLTLAERNHARFRERRRQAS